MSQNIKPLLRCLFQSRDNLFNAYLFCPALNKKKKQLFLPCKNLKLMCMHPLSFYSCLSVFCSVSVWEIECTFQSDNEWVCGSFEFFIWWICWRYCQSCHRWYLSASASFRWLKLLCVGKTWWILLSWHTVKMCGLVIIGDVIIQCNFLITSSVIIWFSTYVGLFASYLFLWKSFACVYIYF